MKNYDIITWKNDVRDGIKYIVIKTDTGWDVVGVENDLGWMVKSYSDEDMKYYLDNKTIKIIGSLGRI